MNWHKDRDFPEIKISVQGDSPKRLCVTSNSEDILRIISAHNEEMGVVRTERDSLAAENADLEQERDALKIKVEYLEKALKPLLGFSCCTSCMERNKGVLDEFNQVCDEWGTLDKEGSV